MDAKQADEIFRYIQKELSRNKFDDILRKLKTRMDEFVVVEEGQNMFNPIFRLRFAVNSLIEIFQNISNDDYNGLLKQFNSFKNTDGNNVHGILVEMGSSKREYDLRELPSYKEIIIEFQEVLRLLNNEN